MFEIAMGIFIIFILVVDMISRNQPPSEEPQEWYYPDDF